MTEPVETMFNTLERSRFFLPSKIVWGTECYRMAGELLEEARSVILFVDHVFLDHDAVTALKAELGDKLIGVHDCRYMPKAQELVEIANSYSSIPDAVVSIGGGSTVDAAKAVIAQWIYGTFDGVGMSDKHGMPTKPGVAKPLLVAMPTTAGTGADLSRYYVTYDAHHSGKVHGKSWQLLADWVLIDSVFLHGSPDQLIVNSAFDAFIHFFESYICRQESSWFGQMLSLDGITRILASLHRHLGGDRSDLNFLELNYAASLGGVAISNVRTGNIHEAAGALLELTPLTHSETLMVFLEPAYRQYQDAVAARVDLLLAHMRVHAPELEFSSFADVIGWWRETFAGLGMLKRMEDAVTGIADRAAARDHIIDRVVKDRVWCTKESPVPLGDEDVIAFIDESLRPYWG